MTEPWRAVVTAILYRTQFAPTLTDAEARRTAEWLVHKPLWDLTVEDEHQALTAALDSGAPLDTVVHAPFAESDKRNFFTRVIAELDTLRPWPDRPYREIPLERWPEFVHLTPIARINLSWIDIQPILGKMFRKPAGLDRELLLLRLNSGAEVGFISPGWPERSDTALVSRDTSTSGKSVIREVLDATSLDPAIVTALPASESESGG